MDEQMDKTNYEQEAPDHPTEEEFVDRATGRLDEALRRVAEIEDRMARNSARGGESDEPGATPRS
jgi:hypothetical protein